jgi:L-fuculose-phosphate aldolase
MGAVMEEEIIRTCLAMNANGLNTGKAGNVSARNDSGFLITASGVPYEQMKPSDVVQMDLDGGYFGDVLPSSEWRMHMDIYRARPEAQAVVHTHAPHATAISCLRKDVPAFHYMIGVTGGATLRCAPYASFGTSELSEAMVEAIKGRNACLLANHGMICFGSNLQAALALAVEVEALCQQYILARQLGAPVILDDAEMEDILRRFKTYGKQASEIGAGEDPAFLPPVRRDS